MIRETCPSREDLDLWEDYFFEWGTMLEVPRVA